MWAAPKYDNRSGATFALVLSANPKRACYVVWKLLWWFHSIISAVWRVFVLSERQIWAIFKPPNISITATIIIFTTACESIGGGDRTETTNRSSEVFHCSRNLKCHQHKTSHTPELFFPQTRGLKAALQELCHLHHQLLLEQHSSVTLIPSLQKPT